VKLSINKRTPQNTIFFFSICNLSIPTYYKNTNDTGFELKKRSILRKYDHLQTYLMDANANSLGYLYARIWLKRLSWIRAFYFFIDVYFFLIN